MSYTNPLTTQFEAPFLRKDIPEFKTGDSVRVTIRVIDGEKKRLQAFEGLVIARRSRGLNSSFTVRKISSGIGIERVFPLHSPLIEKIETIRLGKVRQSKIYYIRERSGKSARVKERIHVKAK